MKKTKQARISKKKFYDGIIMITLVTLIVALGLSTRTKPDITPEEGEMFSPKGSFSTQQEAERLNRAMEGLGTDEALIFDVLRGKSLSEIKQIKAKYNEITGRDMVTDLKDELSGTDLKRVEVYLRGNSDYITEYVLDIYEAMVGMGTWEQTIYGVFEGRNKDEIKKIEAGYSSILGRNLYEDLKGELSYGEYVTAISLIQTAKLSDNTLWKEREGVREAKNIFDALGRKDANAVFDILEGKSAAEITQIKTQYNVITGVDLEDDLIAKLNEKDNIKAMGYLITADKPKTTYPESSTSIEIKSNQFVYNLKDDADYSKVNEKLAKLYDEKGYLVMLRITDKLPSKESRNNLLINLNKKVRDDGKKEEPVIITYSATEDILNFRTDAKYITKQFLTSVKSKVSSEAKKLGKPSVSDLFSLYMDAYIEQLSTLAPERKRIITSFDIEFEKNKKGQEFKGLIGKYDNELYITVYYPEKYGSKNIPHKAEKTKGTLELKDSGCVINYELKQTASSKPALGGLVLDQKSIEKSGSFVLSYKPSQEPTNLRDKVEVNIKCKNYQDKKTKNILVDYRPVIFLIPGLWYQKSDYKPISDFLNSQYGEHFSFFEYADTNTDDIKDNAAILQKFVENKITEVEERELMKASAVIVAHSMGGLITKYMVSAMTDTSRIGKVITLGTPHMGTPLVDMIYDSCPYLPKKYDPDSMMWHSQLCIDYEYMTNIIKGLFSFLAPSFGTLGPAVFQLRQESDFIKSESVKPPKIKNFVVVAGTKPYAPSWLPKIPGVGSYIDYVAWAIKNNHDIPVTMQEPFSKFVYSFFGEGTDGRVPIDSALWNKVVSKGEGVEGLIPGISRAKIQANHAGLVNSGLGQGIIKRLVKDVPYSSVSTGSPVNIYVYDRYGNLVGLKEGELKQQIPNAEFFIDEENVQSIFIDGNEDYTFVVEGTGDGIFSFSVNQRREDKELSAYYEDVPVTDETKASFELTSEEKLILKLDNDGDSIIDEQLAPDTVSIVEIETYDDKDFIKSGTAETDYEKPTSKLLIGALIAAIVIIITLVILLIRKRRY